MSETELDLARRIAAGTARSPTATAEYTWFAMRRSGTDADGLAWRAQFNEHVQRPADVTLSPEMCDRLAGVPLIFLHPKKGELDSKTFEQSVIGTLAFGYVATPEGVADDAGTELWTMARVYSADAIAALKTGELSTSPAVSFSPKAGNETIKLQDGSHVLLEKTPDALSHLAVVPAGVWDRGAGPSGVRIDSTEGNKTMPAEQPAQDIKPDAALGEKIDNMLTKLDSVSKRLDALEKPGARADGDQERDEWLREDAAGCARDDAEEAAETERLQKEYGMAQPVAADAARKARRDRVKARRDAARHRQDSAALSNAEAAALREQSAQCADIQARADSIASAWGERAPAPMQGETPIGYRVRLLRHHQQHCTEPSFKTLDLGALAATHPTALDGIETRIYADSVAASANPVGPDDRMIQRTKIDPDSGHRITEFFGRHTFIHHLKRPSMRATAFLTPNNRAG